MSTPTKITEQEAQTILKTNRPDVYKAGIRWTDSKMKNQEVEKGEKLFYLECKTETEIRIKCSVIE
jgi:hypothetical protein